MIDLTFVTEDILNKVNIEIPGNETLSDHRLVLISYNQNRGNKTFTSKVEGWFINPAKYKDFSLETKKILEEITDDLTPDLCKDIITRAADKVFFATTLNLSKSRQSTGGTLK